MIDRTLRLRVDGWSNARFGKIEGNLIMFEVLYLACACSTCVGRLDAVVHAIQSANVASWQVLRVSIPEREAAASIVLAVEPKEMPAKVDAYLSEIFKLQISEC